MKFRCLIIWLFGFSFLLSEGWAQSINDIKKEKEKSEKEIAYLNKLLKDAQENKTSSLEQLSIIQEKIVQSKRLINSLNQEVKYIEGQISTNKVRINELLSNKKSTLDLYANLVYNLWKRKDKTNALMFIFSSSDFNQAYNRYKYFEQIQDYSKRQLSLITRINDSLSIKNEELGKYVKLKNAALENIHSKNRDLMAQQDSEKSLIQKLQKKEKEILRKLQAEKKSRQRLEKELNKLIASQNKKSGSSSSVYKLTPEEKLISEDFAKNKGKLPWPVVQGIITEKFGISAHPLYKDVLMPNNGISITTSSNADIRAVFNGVVSDILFMPGNNNVVILRHGNYLTVYANLIDVKVRLGQKVKTKEVIGVVAYDSEKGSVLSFQIWKNLEKQNPELWLAK